MKVFIEGKGLVSTPETKLAFSLDRTTRNMILYQTFQMAGLEASPDLKKVMSAPECSIAFTPHLPGDISAFQAEAWEALHG